jgi:hypothetical protein
LAAGVVCLIAVGACVSFRTFGAATVEDVQAEEQYKAVYGEQMAIVHEDLQVFLPSASGPGVCNVGGTKQGCYDADALAIQGLQAMLRALEATPVPPRYADADKLLREAIAENIRGLELRNLAIAESDNAALSEHQGALEHALTIYGQAYAAFPDDNKPRPPP